jgi:hypothetical protein
MDVKELFTGKSFRILLLGVGILLLALASFATGVSVGFHKAKYSYAWGENYERNFGSGFGGNRPGDRPGERPGMMPGGGMMGGRDFGGQDFRNPHGISGAIISISGDTLVVTDREGKENTVVMDGRTVIKNGRDTVAAGNLKAGDQVVIVGNPAANGVVNADLIRIFGGSAPTGATTNPVTPAADATAGADAALQQ